MGLCVSHKQTLRMIKQLGENYDETVIDKRWKTLNEMHTVNQHMPINPNSNSSWCTDSSDTEHEFEIE